MIDRNEIAGELGKRIKNSISPFHTVLYAADELKKCGFDGIVNLDVLDFVAYEPNQIKLRQNTKPTMSASTAA